MQKSALKSVNVQRTGKSILQMFVVSELVTIENRYNPTLNYRYYMIPALMIIVLLRYNSLHSCSTKIGTPTAPRSLMWVSGLLMMDVSGVPGSTK